MSEQKVCTFFKKRGFKRNVREKKASSDESEEDVTQIVRVEKAKSCLKHLRQSTTKRSRMTDKEGNNEEEDEDAIVSTHKASKTAAREGPSDMGATSTLEIETASDHDAQAIFLRAQKINEEQKGKEDDRVYRGVNNYQQFQEVKDTVAGNAASGFNRKGPMRAPTNLRSTVRWDYQPDLCKDYKETGYCGFGDSCKFLHDRTDYKHGWQIEREVAAGTYGNDGDDGKYEVSSSDEDELPFRCLICRQTFKTPVVTKCQHYFCEACAIQQFRKTRRCYACGADTEGVFKPAKQLEERLKGSAETREAGSGSGSDEERGASEEGQISSSDDDDED